MFLLFVRWNERLFTISCTKLIITFLKLCVLSLVMPEFSYELKIPQERVAVLIGKKGEIKEQLEKETKTKIDVDSDEGDVFVKGEDALGLYSTREIVKAIGRGFNPETAMLLLKQDYSFELVNVADYAKTNESVRRLKGRVIGQEGRSRRLIEEMTECYISVYGKTIGIIGEASNVAMARRAVESLLQGSPHAGIYKWLEKQRRTLRMRQLEEKKGF